MKFRRLGAAFLTAMMAFTLAGCNLFAPQVTGDNPTSTQTTGAQDSEKEKPDYAAKLAGTYEMESEGFTEDGVTTHVTKEQYQGSVDKTGLRFTLDLASDGTGVLTSPSDIENLKSTSVKFTWKTDDGKTIVISGASASDVITGKIDENGNIILEITQGKGKAVMVFAKVSDTPGYYNNSSK
ncbi:hypothetical protein [Lancefieldella rimae]